MAGSTDTARRSPVALAIKPMTTAIAGSAMKASAGTMTCIGNSGPSSRESPAPTSAASSATIDRLHREPGGDGAGRDANRLEHREVSQAFERGQIDHRSDDQRRDHPQQNRDDRDRTHRHLQRPEQIGDRPCSVDSPITVGYLPEVAADADR